MMTIRFYLVMILVCLSVFPSMAFVDQSIGGGCQTPQGLLVSNVTKSSARLNWGSVSTALQYELRGNEWNRSGSIFLSIPGSETNQRVSNLKPGTDYWWQIKSCCDSVSVNCSGWSAGGYLFSTSCEVPVNLAAVDIGERSARLVWSAVDGSIGYELRGGEQGGSYVTIQTTNNYLNTGTILNSATAYEWQVRALCNGIDERKSAFSPLSLFETVSFDCNDGIQNGDETAVDCGGTRCQPCFSCGNTLTDPRDGHTYNTIQIGGQCWMAENLNYGQMVNSNNMGFSHADQTDNGVAEKYCYNNDPVNCAVYGGLYEWNELMNYGSSDTAILGTSRGLCPPGWHLPTDEEWNELENYLLAEGFNYDGSLFGNKYASALSAEFDWFSSAQEGTVGNDLSSNNQSGYAAKPAGYRNTQGFFGHLNRFAYFWSSTESVSAAAWPRILSHSGASVIRDDRNKLNGYSCRCVQDRSAEDVCGDGIRNGNETGVDCGGSLCVTCVDRCSDGIQNGDETGIDCGGTSCAPCLNISICNSTNTMFDSRDGRVYATIQIGDQCWMAENLDFGLMKMIGDTLADNNLAEKHCYDDLPSNCSIYGGLYTWNEAMNYSSTGYSNNQGLCPPGWHMPDDEEWKVLERYLGMSRADSDGSFWRGTDQGGQLKDTGTVHWSSPNTGATNNSGFTALPSGSFIESYGGMGEDAFFWTATPYDSSSTWFRGLGFGYSTSVRFWAPHAASFSCRCVKD